MKTYFIITYGCQMNESDSEKIAAKLEKQKYKKTEGIESADLIIINICSVRQSAIDRVYSKIDKIKELNPKVKIVLTGCILFKDKKQFREIVDEIWPIIDFKSETKYKNSKRAFVPIMTGCNNFCSYCAVPYTRGREKSRSKKEILEEIKELISKKYREIMLLGQNVNSYKFNFAKLLKEISEIPGKFEIKFMTSHPKDMSSELIKTIAKNRKISREIHLPIQSGDNAILKKMNRGYTVCDYKKLIKKIKREIPEAILSTDVIVGFPGETKKQFQNTVKLVKEIGFNQIYVACYSPRFGTAAAKLKNDVPSNEKKRRKRIILDLIK